MMGRRLWSLWSEDSILSIGSKGSVLSIGSIGSVASMGSLGSAMSLLLDRLVPVDGVGAFVPVQRVDALRASEPLRAVLALQRWRHAGQERGALDSSRWPGVAIAALSGLVVAAWLLRSGTGVRR